MRKKTILLFMVFAVVFMSWCINTEELRENKICVDIPWVWYCATNVKEYCIYLLKELDKTSGNLIWWNVTIKSNNAYETYKQCIIDNEYLFNNK